MSRTIETMTEQELREEVNYWRQNAASWLASALAAAGSLIQLRDYQRSHRPARQVRELTSVLGSAINGEDMFPGCEGCQKPIKPGGLVVVFDDVGEMHAACAGAAPDQLKTGGRIPLDADDLVLDEGEEPPPDPHLPVFESTDLYTPEQIASKVEAAEEFLKTKRGRNA